MRGGKYDIAIIGAGPAGSTCALALKKAGLRVAMIDKAIFPRDKTCGDGIPNLAMRTLAKVVDNLPELTSDFKKKEQVQFGKFYSPKNRLLNASWSTETFNSPRIDFDNFLLNLVKTNTNTDVFEGISIRQITKGEETIISGEGFEVSCRLVIGCDGANSMVAKVFGKPSEKESKKSTYGIRAYYKGFKIPAQTNICYLIDEVKPGYFWIFPVGENLYNVGLVITKTKGKTHQPDIKKVFYDCIDHHPLIKKKFEGVEPVTKLEGFRIPLWNKKKSLSGDGFMLCGDAAELIVPLQAHGIDTAVISGRLAALQAINCFEKNDFTASFIKAYDREVDAILGKEFRLKYFLANFISRQGALVELAAAVSSNPFINGLIKRLL